MALILSASKGAAYPLGFVRAWKGQMWTLRWSRYFVSLTCKCPWVRAVKDQFCRIRLDSLPTNLGADLSLQSAFSEVLFAFQWLLILPQKTSITWGLFSGGMVSRCWPQSGWPLFSMGLRLFSRSSMPWTITLIFRLFRKHAHEYVWVLFLMQIGMAYSWPWGDASSRSKL